MSSVAEFLGADHRRCDHLFADTEQAADQGDYVLCQARFHQFYAAMEHHFRMEEEVLFPAFEQATGNTMGPTRVMCSEHRQMRDLLTLMEQSLKVQDLDAYLGQAETLLILMQQHNIKKSRFFIRCAIGHWVAPWQPSSPPCRP